MRTSNIIQTTQSNREISENAFAMGIDEASTVFLMDALGKLYSRPAQAALREYLSNAIDAHNAKGGSLPPIQVQLPRKGTKSSQKLSIRDFGKGMTENEFETILSRYGASTKRDSNKMIGGFGLGAKSGFAVSDEFFMTSYQQGTGFRVRIFKDALNQGYVEVVERFPTNEPDGMLVEVPIPDGNIYEVNARALSVDVPFFAGYKPDEIDIHPQGHYAAQSVHNTEMFSPLSIAGNNAGWIRKIDGIESEGNTYALIGSVVYPLDLRNLSTLAKAESKPDRVLLDALTQMSAFKRVIVLDIPIGSVDLPSSREEIIMSERSLRTINAVIINFATLMEQYFQKELNSNKTRREALKYYRRLNGSGYSNVNEMSWQGQLNPLSKEVTSASNLIAYSVRHGIIGTIEGRKMRHYSELFSMSSNADYPDGRYRFTFDTLKELEAVRKLVTRNSNNVFFEDVLDVFVEEERGAKKANMKREYALVVLTLKDDALNDWMFSFKEVSANRLNEVIAKQDEAVKREKEIEALEKAKRVEQRLKAKKAQETRAQSMFSNFTIPLNKTTGAKALTRNTVESIFKNPSVKKYYWAEEEIANLEKVDALIKLNKGQTLLFPFSPTATPNTYEVGIVKSARGGRQENQLIKLRQFLQLFLEKGSKIIILDKNRDLEEFKKTYPEVESAIHFVKSEIAKQSKDLSSGLMVAYATYAVSEYHDSTRKRNGIEETLTKFSTEQKKRLPSDLKNLMESFSNVSNDQTLLRDLGEKYFDSYVKSFSVNIDEKVKESLSIETEVEMLTKKYPLLVHGVFALKEEGVVESLLDYLNMRDNKAYLLLSA